MCRLLIAVASLCFLKFLLIFYLFILWLRWVFVAVCGLPLVAARGVCFLDAELGLLTAAAFLVGPGLGAQGGAVVAVHGLSCSAACGFFPEQGSDPCPLRWQADS